MKQQAAVKESVHARVVEIQQAQAHGISALSEANMLLRSQLTACRDHLQRVLPMQHEILSAGDLLEAMIDIPQVASGPIYPGSLLFLTSEGNLAADV